MNPCFRECDLYVFYKYLRQARRYFEFGCGGSTFHANQTENIEKVYSVESDISWIENVKKNMPKNNKVQFIFIDLKCNQNKLGYPDEKCDPLLLKNYSDASIKQKILIYF